VEEETVEGPKLARSMMNKIVWSIGQLQQCFMLHLKILFVCSGAAINDLGLMKNTSRVKLVLIFLADFQLYS